MLRRDNTVILVIDMQKKLLNVMPNKDWVIERVQRLIKGGQILELPIIVTEQYKKGLGSTDDALVESLKVYEPIEKRVFSCCNDNRFMEVLDSFGCSNILVSGIESHVCVYQTVAQLIESGYHVEVVSDATDSRSPMDKEVSLQKMRDIGATVTTVEMCLFELQQIASGDTFKAISNLIK